MKKSKKVTKESMDEKDIDADDYNLIDLLSGGNWQWVKFELQPKNTSITIRLNEDLIKSLKQAAKSHGIGYQKFIRLALERAVSKKAG